MINYKAHSEPALLRDYIKKQVKHKGISANLNEWDYGSLILKVLQKNIIEIQRYPMNRSPVTYPKCLFSFLKDLFTDAAINNGLIKLRQVSLQAQLSEETEEGMDVAEIDNDIESSNAENMNRLFVKRASNTTEKSLTLNVADACNLDPAQRLVKRVIS